MAVSKPDFTRQFGSAKADLTPVSNNNYVQGWDYVGSTPPTKNDFTYLQFLADQRAIWLHENTLNPTVDLSVAANRSKFGLGKAAILDAVGDGNTVPTAGSFSMGVTGAFKIPTGIIVQWDSGTTAAGGFTKSFPTPFPVQCLALIPAIYSTLGLPYSVVANSSNRLQANINVVNSAGNGISGITVGYIAIGY